MEEEEFVHSISYFLKQSVSTQPSLALDLMLLLSILLDHGKTSSPLHHSIDPSLGRVVRNTLSWPTLQTILTSLYPHTHFSTLSILLHFTQSLLHAVCTIHTPSPITTTTTTAKYTMTSEVCVGLYTAGCMKELVEEAMEEPSGTIIQALHEYVSIFLLFDTICMFIISSFQSSSLSIKYILFDLFYTNQDHHS